MLDMAAQAEISAPAFLRMLIRGIAAETSVTLLQLVSGLTQDLVLGIFADPDWAIAGKAELAAEGTRLLLAAEAGTDLQLSWAQLLSWSATSAVQLDLLGSLLDGSTEVHGLAVDTDLRWAMLRRLAATGQAGDEQIDAELRRDPTDDGMRNALACRAAIGDAEHKAAAWELLAGPDELGYETAIAVGRAFNQSEQADVLEPYAERYFEALPRLWETRSQQSRLALAQLLFPYTAASTGLIERVEEFLAGAERDPGLIRVLIERRDVVQRALRSRALQAAAV
jgi:aminopeptidase N